MTSAAPVQRTWIHALEDCPACPDYALQVARVFADFAMAAGDGPVRVSWAMLRRCTHQRDAKLSKAVGWLRDRGWLAPLPWRNGQRRRYQLSIPLPPSEAVSTDVAHMYPLPPSEVQPLPPSEVQPLPPSEVRTTEQQNNKKRPTLRVVSSTDPARSARAGVIGNGGVRRLPLRNARARGKRRG